MQCGFVRSSEDFTVGSISYRRVQAFGWLTRNNLALSLHFGQMRTYINGRVYAMLVDLSQDGKDGV